VPLISDGEYQYEYNDFLKGIESNVLGSARDSVQDLIDREMGIDNPFMPGSNQQPQQPQKPLPQNQDNYIDSSKYLRATPPAPTASLVVSTTSNAVKIAGPQYVEFREDSGEDQDFLKILFFENINGVALLSLVNSASLETANIQYQPILNMAETKNALDPKTLLALQDTLDKYFLQFPIKLPRTIPTVGNGPNGEHVYLDLITGNLTIDTINLGLMENIEIQTLQNGTIYNTNLGNEES